MRVSEYIGHDLTPALDVAIVCDRDLGFPLHRRTENAVVHAGEALGLPVRVRWIGTTSLRDVSDALAHADAVWVGPGRASPQTSFEDRHGAYRVIRYARSKGLPFLGTCAGFQHAAIEIVNHALGRRSDHPEYGVPSPDRVLRLHACPPAAGASVGVQFVSTSLVSRTYEADGADEQTTCTYGLDPAIHDALFDAGVLLSGFDRTDGEARVLEIPGHPFFVATSFVPQLSSESGAPHPLVIAFLRAAVARRTLPVFPRLVLRDGTASDLGAVMRVLSTAGLVVEDVSAHAHEIVVATSEECVVGIAIVERHGSAGLLRSVAVVPAFRELGIATAVCEEALRRAARDGVRNAYLLTTNAARYFARLGFHEVARDAAPREIRSTRELRELCPSTAVLMLRPLTEEIVLGDDRGRAWTGPFTSGDRPNLVRYRGTVVNLENARAFAEAWCAAWNRHDLEEILSHYAGPPEHSSPLIVERLGRADGTIRNLTELRDYFRRGLDAPPPLRFELLDVFVGAAGVGVLYKNHRGKTVVEVMELNGAGKVARSAVYYR